MTIYPIMLIGAARIMTNIFEACERWPYLKY